MASLNVAAIQMRSGRDPADNIAFLRDHVSKAADTATYIQTPEMTGLLVRDKAEMMAKVRRREISF